MLGPCSGTGIYAEPVADKAGLDKVADRLGGKVTDMAVLLGRAGGRLLWVLAARS